MRRGIGQCFQRATNKEVPWGKGFKTILIWFYLRPVAWNWGRPPLRQEQCSSPQRSTWCCWWCVSRGSSCSLRSIPTIHWNVGHAVVWSSNGSLDSTKFRHMTLVFCCSRNSTLSLNSRRGPCKISPCLTGPDTMEEVIKLQNELQDLSNEAK